MRNYQNLVLLPIAAMFAASIMAIAQTTVPQRGIQDTSSTSTPAKELGPYYALLIGNNNYRYLNKLQTAIHDVTDLSKVLQDRYGFSTKVLTDATRNDVLTALNEYRRTLPDNSNLLIYYAGHGFHDQGTDEAYWLPVDAQKDNDENWISADDITSNTRAMPSLHVLIIADSCYSGALTRDAEAGINPRQRDAFLGKMLGSKSRNLMASGADEPVADGGPAGHSIFAAAILESLDLVPEEQFTATDLFDRFVQPGVAGRSSQVPQYSPIRNSGHAYGDFVFSRKTASMQLARSTEKIASAKATTDPAVTSGKSVRVTPTAPNSTDTLASALNYYKSGQYEQSLPLFRKAAELGNGEAAGYMGLVYEKGLGGWPKDETEAVSWYRKAAEAGDAGGMAGLGHMYDTGHGGLPKDETQALNWSRKAADAGSGRGMNNVGAAYLNGLGGVPKDEVQALIWFRKAVAAGEPRAMTNLGTMYESGRGGLPKDDLQALSWYRKAADGGDSSGMIHLGFMYENGRGGLPRDDVQALSCYRKAADAGDGLGMNHVGFMYEKGRGGLPKDDVQALSWYRKAADGGNLVAMANLGNMYANGRGGLPKDDAQAVSWYRKAAEAGDAHGMNGLGFMYEHGRGGLLYDDVQAVRWYRKASDAGEPVAMTNLAKMYEEGRGGLPMDKTQAVSWYRKAADAGGANAMKDLGYMYEKGLDGLPRDDAQAVSWYRKAAEAQNAEGMFRLGLMYERGQGGLPSNRTQAVSWYRKAASLGNEPAQEALNRLGESVSP